MYKNTVYVYANSALLFFTDFHKLIYIQGANFPALWIKN